jgi:hypothetical protein
MLGVLSGKLNRDMDDVSSNSKRWDSDEIYNLIINDLLKAGKNSQDPLNSIGAIAQTISNTPTKVELDELITKINARITTRNDQLDANRERVGLNWKLHCDTSKVLSTKLAFGLLHQPKWIPLRYAPLTLELELVNDFTDVCIKGYDDANSRFARFHWLKCLEILN